VVCGFLREGRKGRSVEKEGQGESVERCSGGI
jgi:hypothetical protein